MSEKPYGQMLDEMDHQAKYQPATIDPRREQELRIQMLGAALSRRDWHATEQAYNAIRDKFYDASTEIDRISKQATTFAIALNTRPTREDLQEQIDRAEAAEDELARRPLLLWKGGWRDIEGAPINQRILVIGKSRVPFVLYKWHEDGFMDHWRYGSGPENGRQAGWDWTHWMPIPSPPTIRGEKK